MRYCVVKCYIRYAANPIRLEADPNIAWEKAIQNIVHTERISYLSEGPREPPQAAEAAALHVV